MSEHHEQCAVVSWFKMQYPQYARCIMSIPNGAHLAGTPKQRAQKMAKMKKEGFKPGASDLFIAVPKNGFHGLWLEMKDQGKTISSLSDNQEEHLNDMTDQGYAAYWAAGFEMAERVIRRYMDDVP